MKVYKSAPIAKKARTAWIYFVKKNGESPRKMWKMPNNFKYNYSIEHGGWGLWIAQYITDGLEWKDYYDPTTKEQRKVRNIFDFIGKQGFLSKLRVRKK